MSTKSTQSVGNVINHRPPLSLPPVE